MDSCLAQPITKRTICVVTTSYPATEGDPSGHFVRAEVRELERAGHRVTVLKPRPGKAFGWPGVAARLRAHPFSAWQVPMFVATAAMRIRMEKPDEIIAHWALPSGWPIATLSGLEAAALTLVSHGADVRLLCAVPKRARSLLVTALASRAKRWRFVSEHLAGTLLSALAKADRARVESLVVIEPSPLSMIDVTDLVRARRRSIGTRRLYVTASRLVASKRVDKVIDYVAAMRPAHNPVLVVLGDGPARDGLQKQAQHWGLDAHFLGTTPRRETLSWIGAADELVHASCTEGLSTVVREAEQLGVKVTRL
ncbi:MAG: glycosyltransferase [Polyangiaceae bacterium]|nr:glycosyltransferase [Polyangiaceae bacterium]